MNSAESGMSSVSEGGMPKQPMDLADSETVGEIVGGSAPSCSCVFRNVEPGVCRRKTLKDFYPALVKSIVSNAEQIIALASSDVAWDYKDQKVLQTFEVKKLTKISFLTKWCECGVNNDGIANLGFER